MPANWPGQPRVGGIAPAAIATVFPLAASSVLQGSQSADTVKAALAVVTPGALVMVAIACGAARAASRQAAGQVRAAPPRSAAETFNRVLLERLLDGPRRRL